MGTLPWVSPPPAGGEKEVRYSVNQLHQYTYTLQFTPGSDNVVADILSNSNSTPAPHGANDQGEEDIIQIHTTPGHSVTARVRQTSEQVPALSQFCNFIQEGWLSKVPEELAVFSQVKQELSFWNVTCMACGLYTVVTGALFARILAMVHEGHLRHCEAQAALLKT